MKALLEEFEHSLKALNRTGRTISEIRRKLEMFFDYLAARDITDPAQISKDIIRAWQVEIYQSLTARGEPYSVAYQNSLLGAVKTFMAFLTDSGYIVANPARDIRYARQPRTLPRGILTLAEIKKIMRAPDINSVIGYRDRAILEVFYSTGIRKSELRNLRLSDVDYHDGFLRVMGKGRKERIVPLGRIACRYLENYIKSVRPELIRDPYENALFLSSRGNRLNHNAVWVLVRKYAQKAKIKKPVHCHTFRHTCATLMLRNKADIRAIQELLGHSTLTATQVYTRVSINDLKAVHARCHPREKDKQ